MTTKILEAQAIISAVDRTGATFSKIAGELARSESKIQAVGRSMMIGGAALTGAVTLPLVAFGKASLDSAVEFEKGFASVRKVLGDLPTERISEIRREIIDLSTEIPLTAAEFNTIFEGAAQSNVAQQELKDFARLAAESAVAFGGAAEQVGQDLAIIKTSGGQTLEQLSDLTDVINELSNTSASAAPDLVAIVQQVGGLGRVAGLSFAQTAGLGSAMVSAGAGTEVAATAIKNLSLNLTRGSAVTKAQSEAFRALGLESVAVAKAMQKDAAGTIQQVFGRLAKLPEYKRASVAMRLFGKESLGAIGPLISNLELLENALALVGDRTRWTGSRGREFASQMDTADNQMTLLRNNVEALKIELGDELLPVWKEGIQGAIGVLRMLNDELGPETTSKVVALGGGLALIGPALLGIGAGVVGLVKLVGALGSLGALLGRMPFLGPLVGLSVPAGLAALDVADDLEPENVKRLRELQAESAQAFRDLLSGKITRSPLSPRLPQAQPELFGGWWLGGQNRFEKVRDAEALRAEMGLKMLKDAVAGSPIRVEDLASRGILDLTRRSLPSERPPGFSVPMPRSRPLPDEMIGAYSPVRYGSPDAERFLTTPTPRMLEGGFSAPRTQPTVEDIIRGMGKIEAQISEPVTAELRGKADVNVRVQVEGGGRVTGMSADSSGDISADVGVQNVLPDGQL